MPDETYSEFEWAEKELPKVKAFFGKIADILNKFANRHNLNIEKYTQDGPAWDFLFRHPEGGSCYVQVRMYDKRHVELCGDWSIYDIDTGISYDKHTHLSQCSTDKIELENKLEEMLALVLSWNREDLEIVAKRSPDIKEQWTKEELASNLERRFPSPT